MEESTRRNLELWAFPAGTFLGMLFGLFVPSFGPPTRQYIVWLLVPLMVFSLVRIKREEVREGLKRLDLLAVGLVFIYIIVPLVMWGSGLAARLSPDLLFGVAFQDMKIELLCGDWEFPGVFMKARKPKDFKEADLSKVEAVPMVQPK